ncbi:YxiJ family protein [Paenibacillus sp. GCM10027629]|uniref:YxiJ family protein n=1 Tax=Paenibacillus sp. GCM10027629 TaxID=3273414 RepID=UPI003625DF11
MTEKLRTIKLDNPFPYRDTDKIQDDFRKNFLKLTEDKNSLVGDFNTYCMNIAGTVSYVLDGKKAEIPQKQIEKLNMSFFNWFPQYKFFEDRIADYEEFGRKYRNFEEARMLLQEYLS